MKAVCPLQCWRRNGATNGDSGWASAPGQIEWAGLPANLDFAFSREQRDKVYVQHVMREQRRQLWPWLHDGAKPCVCEIAAEDGTLGSDAAKDYV
jgi:hypothetical protein